MQSRMANLQVSLRDGKRLLGLFTRAGTPEVAETLAASSLDFVVLDVEHGSLGRKEISHTILVSSLKDLPVIVRLPDATRAGIQHALTVGAGGVIVPHVSSGREAEAIVAFARSAAIERAYAGAGRETDFRRRSWTDYEVDVRQRFLVIAQIDEQAGVRAAGEIAGIAGLDAVFMGSLSIALSLGTPRVSDRIVQDALAQICQSCTGAGRRIGMHLQDSGSEPLWSERGVSLYVIGNDFGLILDGVEKAVSSFSTQAQKI